MADAMVDSADPREKSRGWLRSAFGRRLGSVGFDRRGGGGSRGGGAASGATGGTSGWSTAGRSCLAATNLGWLAATNFGLTAAATSFCIATNTEHNRDRSSSCPTKHTIHPDLPQFLYRNTQRGCRPSACLPPATALSVVVLREDIWKTGRTAPSFPLTIAQNIGENPRVKPDDEVFLTLRILKNPRIVPFLQGDA
jgi:hypothetical protein